jgi:manganese efflux pump family protein
VLALLLVALAVSLSNLAASVGIGIAGAAPRERLRIGVVFGVFETGMPILGVVLGHSLAHNLGHAARWIGAALLIIVGGYTAIQAARDRTGKGTTSRAAIGRNTGSLVLTGLALSIDNLVVGFALGTYHVSLVVAAAVIGATSVTLSLVGLELGGRLGTRIVDHGELVGGLVLVGVGIAIATGVL